MTPAVQDAVVALATDARLRQAFRHDGFGALDCFRLDVLERAQVASVDLQALDRYAEQLLHKRWHELREVVPLTARVCPGLGERYRSWLALHPAPAVDDVLGPGAREAERSLPALAAALDGDDAEACYTAALLAFEVLERCARIDGRPRRLTARFAVHEIAAELRSGAIPIDPFEITTRYRFARAGFTLVASP